MVTPIRSVWLAWVAAFLMFLVCPAPAHAQVTDAQVDAEIQKLGDDDIAARDAAHTKLQNWANSGQLTQAQVKKIKDTGKADDDLERRIRCREIYKNYLLNSALIRAILDAVRVQILGPIGIGPGATTGFIFDSMTGAAPAGSADLATLLAKYQAVRNALLAGDTTIGPDGLDPITRALRDLRAFINGLTAAQFADLGLQIDGVDATKQQVLDKIDQAINGVGPAKAVIASLSGSDTGPHKRVGVLAGIHQQPDLGQTLSISMAQVMTPGQLDTAMSREPETLARCPGGLRFVGLAHDVLAEQGLAIAGPISITMEMSGRDGVGPAHTSGAPVYLARFANGRMQIIGSRLDPHTRSITGTYFPEPYAPGVEQFGEFAIIQLPVHIRRP